MVEKASAKGGCSGVRRSLPMGAVLALVLWLLAVAPAVNEAAPGEDGESPTRTAQASAGEHGRGALATPIPVHDFARLPEYETAKISPDGEHLAAVMRRDGRRVLVTLELASLDVVGMVNFSPPNEVLSFDWVNDERLIVSVAITLGALDAPVGTGELYGVNADGSQARMIFGVRAGESDARQRHRASRIRRGERFEGAHRLLSLLPEDPRHVLITRIRQGGRAGLITDVARLDVYSGRMRRVARAPLRDAYFLTDRDGEVRFAVGYNDELELEAHYRGPRTRSWECIARMPFDRGALYPVAFSEDERSVYVVDTRHDPRNDEPVGPDTAALRLMDTRDGSLSDVFRHERVDIDALLRAPERDRIYGLRYVPDWPRYRLLDEGGSLARSFERALEAFPKHYIHITSITRDGRRAVVHVRGDREPGTLYLLDPESGALEHLLSSRRWLPPQRLAPTRPIELSARDGTPLSGYLTLPGAATRDAAAEGGPWPLIVLPHGGPHSVRDEPRFDETVQLLAHYGYAVLRVNFRGSAGYGAGFRRAGYGAWDTVVLDDIEDAVRWAIDAGHADPERICAVGFSFGAYAATMSAARSPARYRCAVGIAGVYDLTLLDEEADRRGRRWAALFEATVGRDEERLREASPVYRAERIDVPVLLIHGAEDARAPVEHARRMRDALARGSGDGPSGPVQYLELPGEGHGFYALENRAESFRRLLDFLSRHLEPEESSVLARHGGRD